MYVSSKATKEFMAWSFKGSFLFEFASQHKFERYKKFWCLFCLSCEITLARCVIGTAFIRPEKYILFSFKALSLFQLKPMNVPRRGSDLFAPNSWITRKKRFGYMKEIRTLHLRAAWPVNLAREAERKKQNPGGVYYKIRLVSIELLFPARFLNSHTKRGNLHFGDNKATFSWGINLKIRSMTVPFDFLSKGIKT